MHLDTYSIEPKEAYQSIENVINGHTFAQVEHRSLFGDINPNYLRSSLQRTNTAVLAARCLFKIAEIIDRGDKDQELHFGVPFHAVAKEDAPIPELVDNLNACKLAEKAMLLNTKEIKINDYSTRIEYELSYQGNKLIENNDSEFTYATPIIESFNNVGCLGVIAISAGSLYLTHKIGNEVIDLSKIDDIGDFAFESLFAINGLAVSRFANGYANEIRGIYRAKKVHNEFIKYASGILNNNDLST